MLSFLLCQPLEPSLLPIDAGDTPNYQASINSLPALVIDTIHQKFLDTCSLDDLKNYRLVCKEYALRAHDNIKYINLTKEKTRLPDLEALEKYLLKLAHLEGLIFMRTSFHESFESIYLIKLLVKIIQRTPKLKHLELDFSKSYIDDDAEKFLAEAFKEKVCLTHLDCNMSCNPLKTPGRSILPVALENLPDLIVLDLNFSYNNIVCNGEESLAKELQKILKKKSIHLMHLECLRLSFYNSLARPSDDHSVVIVLSKMLDKFPKLTHLDLGFRGMVGDLQVIMLARGLGKISEHLICLCLDVSGSIFIDDHMSHFGVSFLAIELSCCVNLTHLDLNLRRNSIGDEGAVALAEALKKLVNLTHLRLDARYNQIGVEGSIALVKAFNVLLPSLIDFEIKLRDDVLNSYDVKKICNKLVENEDLARSMELFSEQVTPPRIGLVMKFILIESFSDGLHANGFLRDDEFLTSKKLSNRYSVFVFMFSNHR